VSVDGHDTESGLMAARVAATLAAVEIPPSKLGPARRAKLPPVSSYDNTPAGSSPVAPVSKSACKSALTVACLGGDAAPRHTYATQLAQL
jgi:hypothetical protein